MRNLGIGIGVTIIGLLISMVITCSLGEEPLVKETQVKVVARTVKVEVVPSYAEFKKNYTVLMIDKKDTTATICKDKNGNIWKMRHRNRTDWSIVDKKLIGITVDENEQRIEE